MAKLSLPGRLKAARGARELSRRQLDIKAGLTPGHCAAIESGNRPGLSVQTAEALARALGVSLDWLVNGEGGGPIARAG